MANEKGDGLWMKMFCFYTNTFDFTYTWKVIKVNYQIFAV